MGSATRENRIIAAVACPRCGAPLRRACFVTHDSRPVVCPERRVAWQAHVKAGVTRWVVTLVVDTPHLNQPDEMNAHDIAHAIRHHLHKAGVNVDGLPQVTPERPLTAGPEPEDAAPAPAPVPVRPPLRNLRQIK